jgi:predicted metal-binding membrane protein
MPGMSVGASGEGSLAGAVVSGLPSWLVMAVAMTLGGVLPAVQHIAVNSLRRRRSEMVFMFLCVYLLLWLATGLVVLGLFALLGGGRGAAGFAVALALAAGYELTGAKRRALNRCHRTVRLPPSRIRGLIGAARFGWVNTTGCVGTCGLSMVAMVAAGIAQPAVMVPLTVAMSYGRLTRRPDRARRRIALAYTAGGALTLAFAF